MALMLEITKADGSVARTPLESQATKVGAWPGGQVRIVDTATGKAPANLAAKRVGDSLVVDNLPDGKTVEITKFYTDCSPSAPCTLAIDPADGAQAVTISQSTPPIATLGENQALMYGPTSGAAGAAGAAGASGVPTGAILGGLALLGVAAAAGGGGGSSKSTDTTAPNAPTITAVAGDNVVNGAERTAGVPVSGTAEAGSTVTVTWGTSTKTATADASGNWSVNFASGEVPANGSTTISATARDAAGNASTAGTRAVTVDTAAPTTPVVDAVAVDNVVNAAERTAGVAVTGDAEAGSTVTVTWGATSKTATADASGNWSVNFATGEVPADGNTTISATARDAAGNVSSAGTRAVAIDTVAPGAPTAVAAADGSVSGDALAGSTVKLGNATTTADGAGHYQFAAGTLAAGAASSVTASDAAGNASAATPVTGYELGTAAADTLIGSAAFVDGGAGNDVLVGGAGGSVRNYQFEYWNNPAVLYNDDGEVITFGAGAQGGWTVGNTPTQFTADPLGTPVTQHSGGDVGGVFAGMNLLGNALAFGTEDDTGGGARFYWRSVRNENAPGATLSQDVVTDQGAQYTLSMQVSDNDYGTSMGVYWGGQLLAQYDGLTNTWSGTAPTVTDIAGTNRQTWSWTVTGGNAATTALELRAYSDIPQADGDANSMFVDRVTLDPIGAAGNGTIVGGAGSDLIFGQGGDDTLYGGAFGDTAATANHVADAFVYSMRAGNGADVIKDFEVGTDKIVLIDALDTFNTAPWQAPPADANVGTTDPAPTTSNADTNLSFEDFVQGTSPSQYLTVEDNGSGSVKLGFWGETSTGTATALGSVVLEGVAFGAGAGQYDSVQDLFTAGVLVATMDGFHTALV